MLRLFIALDFPQELKTALHILQQQFKSSKLIEGKFIDQDSLHLTFKFIGEIEQDVVQHIHNHLQSIHFKPFEVTLGSLDTFSRNNKIEIIWIDLVGPVLYQLQQAIEQVLFWLPQQEQRPFVAHVTLVRVKKVHNYEQLQQMLQQISIPEQSFTINQFSLQRSTLAQEGPLYTALFRYNAA